MKNTIRIRRRDGVTQRYKVGTTRRSDNLARCPYCGSTNAKEVMGAGGSSGYWSCKNCGKKFHEDHKRARVHKSDYRPDPEPIVDEIAKKRKLSDVDKQTLKALFADPEHLYPHPSYVDEWAERLQKGRAWTLGDDKTQKVLHEADPEKFPLKPGINVFKDHSAIYDQEIADFVKKKPRNANFTVEKDRRQLDDWNDII